MGNKGDALRLPAFHTGFKGITRSTRRPFDSEHASTEAGCELHFEQKCCTALTCVRLCSEARTGCFTSRVYSLRQLRLLAAKFLMNEACETIFSNWKLRSSTKLQT